MKRIAVRVVFMGLCSQCSYAPEDLPETKVEGRDAACGPENAGIAVRPPTSSAGSDLSRCATIGWAWACEDSVTFRVSVDEFGRANVLGVSGDQPPGMKACIMRVVAGSDFGPATDCRGHLVRSDTEGHITWTRDRGTYTAFAGISGVIGAIDPQCMTAK
jgi:hypothetical protein